ncbi:MAG: hypothetical protein IBX72_06475 [Nitrospirae bacterium]|jgi:hypothetical protein|nr:hypothetical protein [Nitrospirota bacterium]
MEVDKVIHSACTASEEDLKSLVHHPSSKVISKILLNLKLTEELVIIIANRKNVNPEVLESISADIRWKDSYRIKLALCKNPKTPQRISLSLVKSLKIFDVADLTRNQNVPINLRIKAEAGIIEKILSLPLGIKMTLARRSSSNILVRLIKDGMKEVVAICLDSPYITEGDICKIISMKKITTQVIRQIANHPKWSCRYNVQWALVLNNYTPLSCVVNFLKNIKTTDLKELYNIPALPPSTKPFIYRELLEREEV